MLGKSRSVLKESSTSQLPFSLDILTDTHITYQVGGRCQPGTRRWSSSTFGLQGSTRKCHHSPAGGSSQNPIVSVDGGIVGTHSSRWSDVQRARADVSRPRRPLAVSRIVSYTARADLPDQSGSWPLSLKMLATVAS
jgi:hypothetical protein